MGARTVQHGLAGEQRRAFGDGEDIASEAEFREVIEEGGGDVGELRQAAEIVDLFGQ